MPLALGRAVRRALVIAALALIAIGTVPLRGAAPTETRALWVLRTSLSSPESIATLVRTAREHGFNTLLVQVRGRGDAYYNGGVEARAAELLRQPPTFDPLQAVLTAAHDAGLRVHAWVNVNFVSSAVDIPTATTHVVHRHPEWLMVPRDLAQELSKVPDGSPCTPAGSPDGRARNPTSRGCTSRLSSPQPRSTSTPSFATLRLVTIWTAFISTTSATRTTASTTAAAPSVNSATRSGQR